MQMVEKSHEEFKGLLEHVCDQYIDKTAIVYMQNNGLKKHYTFGQIFDHIKRNTDRFIDVGLQRGDRCAIISPHSPFAVIAGLSLAYANITSVLIDYSLPAEEINRLLKLSDVRAIFTTSKTYETLDKSLMVGVPVFDLSQETDVYEVFNGVALNATCPPTADPDPEVIAILFSSGTTSSMKGVMISYMSVVESKRIYPINTGLTADKSYLFVLPFNHIAGFSAAFQYFLIGCELDMIEDMDATKIQKALLDFKPNFFAMVPKVYEAIEQKIRQSIRDKGQTAEVILKILLAVSGFTRRNFGINIGKYLFKDINSYVFGGRMHGLGTGASPCKESTSKFFLDLGYDWANFYASTETNVPTVCTGILDKYPVGTVGNINRFEEVKVKIYEPDSSGIGEIYINSKIIMKGYFREPELTKEAFDNNGFFKTGDLGYIDKKGYLHVVGRIKETIILHNGKKVSPFDVDSFYNGVCPDILLASCGVPDNGGAFDEIHLFIESGNFTIKTQQKIRKTILDFSLRTSTFYKISGIHFIDKIPMTSVGKIKRFELKELAIMTRAAKGSIFDGHITPDNEGENTSKIILKIATSIAGENDLQKLLPESDLKRDLGFDSLTMLEMCVEIENVFNVSIAENMGTVKTVQDLIDLINGSFPNNTDVEYNIEDYPLPKSKIHIKCFKWLMWVFRVIWKFEISGFENIPKHNGYILCPNHQSHFDGLWVWAAIGKKHIDFDKIACLAKEEHLNNGLSRFGLTMLGGIPVDRSGNTIPAIQRGLACIQNGYTMLIHPEGTRTRDGKMNDFKGGAAKLAIETKVPVVPVRIDGAWDIFPPHNKYPRIFRGGRRYVIKISFGEPINPHGKSIKELTDQIQSVVLHLGELE